MSFKKIFFMLFLCCATPTVIDSTNFPKNIVINEANSIFVSQESQTVKLNETRPEERISFSELAKNLFSDSKFAQVKVSEGKENKISTMNNFIECEGINISGNYNISTRCLNKLFSRYNIQKNYLFDLHKFKKCLYFLNKLYRDQGYFGLHVKVNLTFTSENKLQMNMIISEGSALMTDHVFIQENRRFSKEEFLKNISYYNTNYTWNNFFSLIYNKYKYKELIQNIRNFYLHDDVLDLKISAEKEQKLGNNQQENIIIPVIEGLKYVKKTIFGYNLEKYLSEKNIINILEQILKVIDSLKDSDILQDMILNLASLLEPSKSYIFKNYEINKTNKPMSKYFLFDKDNYNEVNVKPVFWNRDIHNERLNQQVNRNKKNFFNISKIKKIFSSLFHRHIFTSAQVFSLKKIDTSYKEDDYDHLNNDTETRQTNIFTSYDTNKGILLNLCLLENNLFRTGSQLYLHVMKNISNTNIKLNICKYFNFFKKFILQSDFFFNREKKNSVLSRNLIDKVWGICTSFSRPSVNNKKLSISGGYEAKKIDCSFPHSSLLKYLSFFRKKISLDNSVDDITVNDYFLKYLFDFNNIKEKNFVKLGTHIKSIYKLTLPFSDNFYHKFFFSINQYNIFRKLYNIVIHNYFEHGSGFSLGERIFPFYENYKFYNNETQSAFKDNSIGPTATYYSSKNKDLSQNDKLQLYPSSDYVGGNIMTHANTEILFPHINIFNKLFRFFQTGLFIDLVNIWDTNSKQNPLLQSSSLTDIFHFSNFGNPYISCGAFLRAHSFLGPVTFTFALPINAPNVPDNCINKFSVRPI